MKVILIRHGETYGNELKRYIGITDESLSEKGRKKIEEKCEAGDYPVVEKVFVSPLKRCVETAGIIYPECESVVLEKLRECNFGEFENKNYQELNDNVNYQAWIDSNGTLPFPKGESVEEFKKRCVQGFLEALEISRKEEISCIALVVHGGTIMSVLEQFLEQEKTFYDYHVKNGEVKILLAHKPDTCWQVCARQ